MILAIINEICLLYETVCMGFGIAVIFYYFEIYRNLCFIYLFPLIMCHCVQTGTVCILALDLFIAILFPIEYRKLNTQLYFSALFFIPIVYAFYTAISGWFNINNEPIKMCNPPSSLTPKVTSEWYFMMLLFSFATLFFYAGAFAVLKYKVFKHSNELGFIEQKALKTLQVLILVFLITRCISISLFNILIFLKIDKQTVELCQNYNVILAVVAYSQNGYVCYVRSSEYRRLFRQQLHLFMLIIKNKLRWRRSARNVHSTQSIVPKHITS
ncbi:unnamed protein product [Caenorhabditis bovis]|uniref:G-protein coupled receptors family 1 profile domain-containing protein n=1 Tax=Caenorhabditis bovis TaxID=2654633 RepID=A0A8S1F1B8_9PELO|nr:unnamed protein product [Caenorhabditis bovis]